ncbi:related to SEC31-component of the COPII coat of ER-golgi vesicles [Sporisorium reilianum f. sp. reilianum]|uniref:Protein transport protein SEC31 n=1 Tax=Sporisorium reilianum f. sp. reilianum TaxID=72559 RepID=A0A2N8UKE0_9BASI|nr:related to SEC31-component of the COPII coat of ER-golgi vesicles [Sporisorium reilianum f. sp. reilianum]
MKAYINRTATFAWSPATYESDSPLIATGTVAGALDESFSNESVLELWQPCYAASASASADAKSLGSISTSARFNRLAWGYANPSRPNGLLAAGLENGELGIWDAQKILAGASESDAQVIKNTTHTGPVRGLDFNPLQPNLLSSGAVAGEIFIWDLNSPAKPYSPGARSQKLDEITSLAWNCQVPHVLATSSSSGYTVVWDLKGKREVVALQYGGGAGTAGGSLGFNAGGALAAGGRRGMSAVAWHPDTPTRLVTASEDDSSPVIMLWDLRNSRAPEKIMTGHDKGILSLSWCKQDADLLLSCGKDNRSICWNPQTCEVVGELPSSSNWSFEVQWSPRNPGLLATASFDGKIGVHSLQSTNAPESDAPAQQQPTDDSDFFNQTPATETTSKGLSLKQPPKWLRRPVSAVFGFGGQLVSSGGPSSKPFTPTVHLRDFVSEPSIVERATKLQQALDGQSLAEFCAERSQDPSTRPDDIANWKALQTLFHADSRDELVALLGFSKEDVAQKVSNSIAAFKSNGTATSEAEAAPVDKVIDEPEPVQPATSAEAIATQQAASTEAAPEAEAKQAEEPGLFGDDAADPANKDASDFFSQISADPTPAARSALPSHLLSESQPPIHSSAATAGSPGPSSVASETIRPSTFKIYPSEESEADKLITRALVLGDFESAVSLCINSDRFADAFLLAVRGGQELLDKTQKAYFEKRTAQLPYLRLFQSIVSDDLSDVVQNADLSEWQEIFVVLCTFAKQDEFSNLTEQLGQRLEFQYTVARNSDATQAKEHRKNAVLCYLAAGKLEKVAGMWIDEMKEEELSLRSDSKSADASHEGTLYSARAEALQTFMEKITVFQSAVGYVDVDLQQPTQDSIVAETGARSYKLAPLYDRIHEYVELLADQGLISPALRFANQTPADYRPTGPVDQGAAGSLTATALKQRLLKAEIARPKGEPAAAAAASSANNGTAAAAVPTSSYATAPTSNGYSPYDYGASTAPSIPSIPAVPSVPAVPTYHDPYAAAAPAPAAAAPQPATQSRYAPAVPAVVPAATQPEPTQANPYGGYGAQGYQSAYQPAQPMIPAPPAFGGASYQQQQQQQLPPPPPLKRDQSGWNDVPEGLSAPKRTPSAMSQHKSAAAITSPFPNAPSQAPSPYGGAPGAPPAGPPRGATPSRGMMSPPPQGPPSGPGLAQQRNGPPGVRPPPMGPAQGQPRPGQQQGPYGAPAQGQPQPGPPGQAAAPPAGPYARPPAGPAGPYGNGVQQQQGVPPGAPGAGTLRPPGPGAPGAPGLAAPPGVPQRSATPGGGAGAPPRSATPGARGASQMKYPPGDRSHIPENQRPIQHALQREVARLKSTAPPAQKRMVDDTERRINLLLDHLNCGTIDAKTVSGLMQIVAAIEARNKQAALNIHLQLVTSSSGDVAAGLVGVKMIISRL